MTGLWVLVGVLVAGATIGLVLRARNGRIRAANTASDVPKLPEPVTELLDGDTDVTLVQISTTFCAPCRHARARMSALAERTDGLRHVELDVTQRPELARELNVLRTPTTLALRPDGREILRISGVPDSAHLSTALGMT